MPQLASPLTSLRRISRFAENYGTRSQFLANCSLDPSFFEVLALLFDRSEFIYELLCHHPEILDEVLRPGILRRRKSVSDILRELREGAPRETLEDWLWLYVKAEQIRVAIGDLLGYLCQEETEECLSSLADAVLTFTLQRMDPEGRLLVVALGKYGGGELTFGSDLDLLFLSRGDDPQRDEKAVRQLAKCLSHRSPLGATYEIDLRLRPHGQAGPMAPTLPALRRYYYHRGAQNWEKQVLARARPVTGNADLQEEFSAFLNELLYLRPCSDRELQELWNMRLRIERERDRTDPPERSFKSGPGGLIELEFFGQFLQLRHGHHHPELREPNTRRLLRAIGRLHLMDPDQNGALMEAFDFLKRVEVLLRRNKNSNVSVIGESPDDQSALARWSGFKDRRLFWDEHQRHMASVRRIVGDFLAREFHLNLSGDTENPARMT